ncbi:MAG: glycosyltransferase [Candidatus Calescibacterium sp.]|nr:glycosyltransferase [Candidatus Calescibacterium sp.]MCX7733202.1 glycosyltransferase [bacterium]MDW8086909.1 glycosyltransferase [Candidatus Calescibacterium sp.]
MRIVQVLPEDINGGAFRVPVYLHREYEKLGFRSFLVVGEKHSNWDFVIELPNRDFRSSWAKFLLKVENIFSSYLNFRGSWRIKEFIRFIGQPSRQLKIWLGYEDFDFPGTSFLIDFLKKERIDILNLHVLHGFWLKDRGFFDLRLLPQISKITPTVFTLHDMWLITGHCSHSFDCERWKTGCGSCPDITIPPAIRRDLSHKNWLIKKSIYQKSSFWCIAPSEWMARMAQKSILSYGLRGVEVIYNFVDLETFRPLKSSEKLRLKKEFGIPHNSFVLVSAGKSLRTNRWKGFDVLVEALKTISDEYIFVLALGGTGYGEKQYVEQIGNVKIIYIPFEKDHRKVAIYYAISDAFVLTSRAENFPLSVIEASACGAVPIASDVGGVREMIRDGENGFVVDSGNYVKFAERIKILIEKNKLLRSMRIKAIENSKRFSIENQLKKYINFFQRVVDDFYKYR